MAWEKGNQKERISKTRGINKQLLAGDIGFLEEKEAKILFYKFLRENITFAADLLMGIT